MGELRCVIGLFHLESIANALDIKLCWILNCLSFDAGIVYIASWPFMIYCQKIIWISFVCSYQVLHS